MLVVREPRPVRARARGCVDDPAALGLAGVVRRARPAHRRDVRLADRRQLRPARRPAARTSCTSDDRPRRRSTRRTPGRGPAPATVATSPRPAQWFESDPLWFKRAVFYEIHIRGFPDGNDDGTGDFRGLTEKLDYLQWLGVDCLWLLPIYPSPLRDGGYDIADFYSIHPDYGTRRRLPHASSRRRTSAASA